MENTSPFLFDNSEDKFFIASQGRALGPLTAQEVYEKIQRGEITLLHYFWCEDWSDWKQIHEEDDFAVLIPQKPPTRSIQAIREKLEEKARAKAKKASAKQSASSDENFYLYFNRTQYGPFKRNELIHVLQSHKLDANAYLWTPGWANWKSIGEIEEFAAHLLPPAPELDHTRVAMRAPKRSGKTSKIEKSRKVKRGTNPSISAIDASDKRKAPRRPLVARLFLHNDKDVIIAVCRDISVGGMQVLTDRIPGPVGSVIKLNVSPGDPEKVKGFVAEGEIVRVLEDGRGFSFRFRKITDEAKRTIERYIKSDI